MTRDQSGKFSTKETNVNVSHC